MDSADRVAIVGDFTIGRATTPLVPDVETLTGANPALFERLDALGWLTATLIVDQDGVIRRRVLRWTWADICPRPVARRTRLHTDGVTR